MVEQPRGGQGGREPVSPAEPAPGNSGHISGISENSRLIYLLAALADSRRPVRAEWLFTHVPGYQRKSADTQARYLRSDLAALRELGITITEASRPRAYQIDHAKWAQDDPELTDAEAAVVFAAANAVFTVPELHDAALSGWRKIASFGSREEIARPDESLVISDKLELNKAELARLLAALTPPRTTVTFWYSRRFGVEDELRTLEPWRIITVRGRYYLLGFDVDRKEERLFRFSRISEVVDTGEPVSTPLPPGSLQEHAERMLLRDEPMVRAQVRVRPGTARELLGQATELGKNRFELSERTITEVVHLGLSLAPDVIVESPEEARSEIISRLEQVVALHGQASAQPPTPRLVEGGAHGSA